MRGCKSDAQCGVLSCECGVCTSRCESDEGCAEALGESAICVSTDRTTVETRCPADVTEAAAGVCMPQCDDSEDCEAIDSRLTCVTGLCLLRVAAEVPPPDDGGVPPGASPTMDASPQMDASSPPPDGSRPPSPQDDGSVPPRQPQPAGAPPVLEDGSVGGNPREIASSLERGELWCTDLLKGADIEGLKTVRARQIDDFELHDTGLYYATWTVHSVDPVGVIRHVDADGQQLEEIDTPLGVPAFALEGNDLIWAESDGLSVEIHSRPIEGGSILDLGPPSAPYANVWGLVADPNDIFWFTDGLLLRSDRVPRATMPVASDLTTADSPTNTLLADETYLYYQEGDYPQGPRTIHRVPKDGSAAPTEFLAGSMPFRFTIAGGYLYFSEPGSRDEFGNHDGNGRIVRRLLEGTDLEVVATAESQPLALAVDDAFVYWLEIDRIQDHAELWRAPIGGEGEPARLLTSDLLPDAERLTKLELTAGEIYWRASCQRPQNKIDDFILGMAKPAP